MTNKKSWHQRSVETLGLSNYDDERILAEITEIIQRHSKQQPYSRNTLLRIKDKVDRYLLATAGEGESV